jgi:predicted Zn-dependent protease
MSANPAVGAGPARGGGAGQEEEEENDAETWIRVKLGLVPKTSLGWFRAGVGFYNKKQFAFAIQCLQRSVKLDPHNYNAFQIMARACIAVNRRDDAVVALKESVKLNNPSDWQLLVELTGKQPESSR